MFSLTHDFILSYSGGKDSTAMLHYCLNNSIPVDEVIYVRDIFPYGWRLMYQYFKYIEKTFNIKITRLKTPMMDCLIKWGKPKLPHPYCIHLKVETMINYLKEKYGKEGITILMGIRRNESRKRNNYQYNEWGMPYYFNNRYGINYLMEYPIFKMEDPINYLQENDIKINPLYKKYNLKRLSCKYCVKVKKLWEDQGI